MLMSMAYGGALNTSLWQGVIANSPYTPLQYNYNDSVPQNYYDGMVKLTGCAGPNNFTCLSNVPYLTAYSAAVNLSITLSVPYTWSANPVTDGILLQQAPSAALFPGAVNGEYAYVGHTSNEGYVFVPENLNTSAQFLDWLETDFPLPDNLTRSLILQAYPEPSDSNGQYTTQSGRASLLYAHSTFVCPAYWLALSYPNGKGYKYIDGVGTGYHGSDLSIFFLDGTTYNEASAVSYVDLSMSAFWTTWNPANNPTVAGLGWMPYDYKSNYQQINYNLTSADGFNSTYAYLTEIGNLRMPYQCQFLRAIGPMVPE